MLNNEFIALHAHRRGFRGPGVLLLATQRRRPPNPGRVPFTRLRSAIDDCLQAASRLPASRRESHFIPVAGFNGFQEQGALSRLPEQNAALRDRACKIIQKRQPGPGDYSEV
jgi:hypothetical protein